MNVWFTLLLFSLSYAKFGPPTQTSVPNAFDVQPIQTPSGPLVVIGVTPQNSAFNASLLLLDANTFQQLDKFNLPSCFPGLTKISTTQILLTCDAYTSGCAPTFLAIIQITPNQKISLSTTLTTERCGHLILPTVSQPPTEIYYLSYLSSGNTIQLEKLDLASFTISTEIPNATIVNNSWLSAAVAFDQTNSPLLISSFYSSVTNPTTWTLAVGPTTPSANGGIVFTHQQITASSAFVPFVFPNTQSNGITIDDDGSSLHLTNWNFATFDNTLGDFGIPGTSFYSGGVVVNVNLNNLFIAGYGLTSKGYSTLSQISIENGIATKVTDQTYLDQSVNSAKFDVDNNVLFIIGRDNLFKYPIM